MYRHQTIESKTFYLMYDFRFTKIIFMEDVEICGLVLKIVAREKKLFTKTQTIGKIRSISDDNNTLFNISCWGQFWVFVPHIIQSFWTTYHDKADDDVHKKSDLSQLFQHLKHCSKLKLNSFLLTRNQLAFTSNWTKSQKENRIVSCELVSTRFPSSLPC